MRFFKPLVFIVSALPLAWLVWAASFGLGYNPVLGANPIEALNRELGDWALRFLLITLAVTPFTKITKWTGFMRARRMLGLWAFTYAMLHLSSYVVLDQFFAWDEIWKDIVKRNFITVGMAVIVVLTMLAVTSTTGWVKRLGGKRWQKLHKLVYAAGIGGVVHFFLMVKADVSEPMIYAVVLAVLLGWRVVNARRAKRARR